MTNEIKNADMPAMPAKKEIKLNSPRGSGYPSSKIVECSGLTKREMFAMNAPEIPDWFEREFSQKHFENKDYYHIHHDEFAEHFSTTYQDILPLGQMALIKAWRYAYADLMTGE